MKMKILAHRGYWKAPNERNSLSAIRSALGRGYGFESDVRDYAGRLVMSHDIADASSPDAEEVFRMLAEYGDRYCFAVNVKADGLKGLLAEQVARYGIRNYFLFDMSVPQMVEYAEKGLRFFTRQSEYETVPALYGASAGVWMDGFEGTDWITADLLNRHTDAGKEVCLVSPDLHDRTDYTRFWGRLADWDIDFSKVLLCTDHPDEAKDFFNGKTDRRK